MRPAAGNSPALPRALALQLLRDEGLYESQEEAELRETVLGRLDSIVKVRWPGWMRVRLPRLAAVKHVAATNPARSAQLTSVFAGV